MAGVSNTHNNSNMAMQRVSASGMYTKRARVREYSRRRVLAAWLVHLYTAMGLCVNVLAIHYALYQRRDFGLFATLNWLAILVDATDGTFARAVDVKAVAPTYDGALLDNIIDFQTFSLLPALAVCVFDIVPGLPLQMSVAAAILIASAYQFCQATAKTDDAFVGFPSYWNILLFYVYYLNAPLYLTLFLFYSCAILSFVPVHFIYPTRTKTMYKVTIVGAYIWAILLLVPTILPKWQFSLLCVRISLLYVVYYFVLSFVLDFRRRNRVTTTNSLRSNSRS